MSAAIVRLYENLSLPGLWRGQGEILPTARFGLFGKDGDGGGPAVASCGCLFHGDRRSSDGGLKVELQQTISHFLST